MENQEEIRREMLSTLDEYFSRGVDRKKFIDVNRIPLICQDISSIHTSMKEINDKLDNKFVTKESFWAVKMLVYGAATLILTTAFGELLKLIIK